MICGIHQAGKELAELDELTFYSNLRDSIRHSQKIWLLKDLKWGYGQMIHESYQGNGFCYRRVSKELGGLEQLAYTGYFGAWTDNPQYYERIMCPNTQLRRAAIKLKFVCYFHIRTTLDKVDLDHKNPTYDFYMYHGGNPSGFKPVDVKVSIKYDD